jgi:hypothetical protein
MSLSGKTCKNQLLLLLIIVINAITFNILIEPPAMTDAKRSPWPIPTGQETLYGKQE